jgi:hypothetical protein
MAPKAMWKKLVQLQVCCAQDMVPTLPPNSVTVPVLLQRPMNCSDLHTACSTCVRPLQCLSFIIIDSSTCNPPSGMLPLQWARGLVCTKLAGWQQQDGSTACEPACMH